MLPAIPLTYLCFLCLHLSLSSSGLITAGHRGKDKSVTVTTVESDVQSDNAIISAEAHPCACCWASAKDYFGLEVWLFYCLHVDRAFLLVSLEMRFSLERSLKSTNSLGVAEILSDYQCFYLKRLDWDGSTGACLWRRKSETSSNRVPSNWAESTTSLMPGNVVQQWRAELRLEAD